MTKQDREYLAAFAFAACDVASVIRTDGKASAEKMARAYVEASVSFRNITYIGGFGFHDGIRSAFGGVQ